MKLTKPQFPHYWRSLNTGTIYRQLSPVSPLEFFIPAGLLEGARWKVSEKPFELPPHAESVARTRIEPMQCLEQINKQNDEAVRLKKTGLRKYRNLPTLPTVSHKPAVTCCGGRCSAPRKVATE
jgi:hypothetical protein